MKTIFVVLLAASSAVLINGQFSKKLESLDVDMILKNDRILTNYVKCILDKGKLSWTFHLKQSWSFSRSRSVHKRRSWAEKHVATNTQIWLHWMQRQRKESHKKSDFASSRQETENVAGDWEEIRSERWRHEAIQDEHWSLRSLKGDFDVGPKIKENETETFLFFNLFSNKNLYNLKNC